MEVRKTLTPGQDGTKELAKQYGDQLICVRYRYDKTTKRRIKTIELVVEDIPWIESGNPDIRPHRPPKKVVTDVLVHINYEETALRQKVKMTGGRWLKDQKAWMIDFENAKALGLEKRIIELIDKDEPSYYI
jgi:hypothetical protein